MMQALKNLGSLFILGCALCTAAIGQSLLDDLGEEPLVIHPVSATFKDTRIINAQSNETPGKNVLHFVIAHRFGQINEGAYALWGLDNASMRMAFDYGITDRLAVGVARSTFQKTYEANIKWRALRQNSDNSMPVSVTFYSVTMANGLIWPDPTRENYFSSRLSYVNQAILTKKWGSKLSLALIPSFIHRNLVESLSDSHDQWTLGAGGRYKVTSRASINAEYHYAVAGLPTDHVNSLSLGMDIETGGHVFQLHVTNSQGMFERAFLTETGGRWRNGALYFGFNLSRVFDL
jgi:opacity protein-like surface antigen